MTTVSCTIIESLRNEHGRNASRWACSRALLIRLRLALDSQGERIQKFEPRGHRMVEELFGLPLSSGQDLDDTTLVLLDAAGNELGRCVL